LVLAALAAVRCAPRRFNDAAPKEAGTEGGASCVDNSYDPYAPNATYISGPAAGKCIDTTLYRNVVEVEKSSTISIANVYHKGRFVIAN
jgi:hypothetical protein